MLEYLKEQSNLTLTENGAVTYLSTNSYCLDLFATVGALRRASEEDIKNRFTRAFCEDRDTAVKLLFFARDIRAGLGERRVFRVLLQHLAELSPESAKKNLAYIAEYGRYDDILALVGTLLEKDALDYLKARFEEDEKALAAGEPVSLLAKWLPSVNATNKETVRLAKKLARHFGMKDAEYRKALVALRARIRIIENHLRERDYTFDYAKQPSKAMYKYRAAFLRNDNERYTEFMEKVSKGEKTLHTGTLMPYEVLSPILEKELPEEQRRALDVTWRALEDFGGDDNSLCVVDGSGSMYCCGKPTPASVAFSLGIYFAERNRGAFHNHFITFSEKPRLIEIQGKDIYEKVKFFEAFDEAADTNLCRVFDLLLNTAVEHHLSQDELPKKLYIISDMEFNYCMRDASMTNFEYAKSRFEEAGYRLPEVVFWNVASRNCQQPVTKNEQGVVLVSGCTPRLFSMVASGAIDPMAFMREVIESERYAVIHA